VDVAAPLEGDEAAVLADHAFPCGDQADVAELLEARGAGRRGQTEPLGGDLGSFARLRLAALCQLAIREGLLRADTGALIHR